MKTSARSEERNSGVKVIGGKQALILLAGALLLPLSMAHAQAAASENLSARVQQLTADMARTEAQLKESQRELDEMRRELSDLQRQTAEAGSPAAPADSALLPSDPPSASTPEESSGSSDSTLAEVREHQALQQSEIATQAQSKVESASKYPVKVTGMLLMNGFKNTSAVDLAANPSVALNGPGNAGASVRQTQLGFDASGPRIFGARSFADLRVDFYGSPGSGASTANYNGYYSSSSALVRLRTAHAGLYWDRTQAYFALDRPILSPDAPTSLTATAIPALAWSGNLWTWNPQAVITQEFALRGPTSLELQGALIDAGDAPLTPATALSTTGMAAPPSSAEQTSEPGGEARIAITGPDRNDGRSHFGIGGYVAPHSTALGHRFDAWAATFDLRVPLFARLELSGNSYRGAGLGGLGEGAYKDFVYSSNTYTGGYYFRLLDDVGGWAQLKERATERLEFNAAIGMDNDFAHELRSYYVDGGTMVQNLARNRTITGNVIYSPSAYLLFSLEYRRLTSTPVEGVASDANIIGLGAGYKF
jgi:hypothetical protein